MKSQSEVIVIGAGPAGAMAAYALSGKGIDVLLVDRRAFPREKVCGDGLIPDAHHALERAALYDRVAEKGHRVALGAVYSPGRHEARVKGRFLTLRRRDLDQVLLEAAVEAGTHFEVARAESLAVSDDGVVVRFRDGNSAAAAFAVVATGANLRLLEPLGAVDEAARPGLAFRSYYRGKPGLDRLVVSFDQHLLPGYAWIFPMGGDLYNVGAGAFFGRTAQQIRGSLERFLEGFPLARELFGPDARVAPVRGSLLRCGLSGVRPVTRGRVFAAGDAVCATFPFTGEGIGKAMETGLLAGEAIATGLREPDADPRAAYEASVEALRPKYEGYRIAERWVSRAWLADFLVSRVRRSPLLTQRASEILDEAADPRLVFSVPALVRSLVS